MKANITWRKAGIMLSRLAARGRKIWLSFFAVFAQYLRNVSGLKFLPQIHLDWVQFLLKTRMVKKFEVIFS